MRLSRQNFANFIQLNFTHFVLIEFDRFLLENAAMSVVLELFLARDALKQSDRQSVHMVNSSTRKWFCLFSLFDLIHHHRRPGGWNLVNISQGKTRKTKRTWWEFIKQTLVVFLSHYRISQKAQGSDWKELILVKTLSFHFYKLCCVLCWGNSSS